MSIEQLDDSEFLSHVAWLAGSGRHAPPEVAERLRAMADVRGCTGRMRSHLPGDEIRLGEPSVLIRMSRFGAADLIDNLSSLLCWCRGYVAALPEDLERHPMHWEVAREINIALRRALNDTDGRPQQ